jgi:hypothetical protein
MSGGSKEGAGIKGGKM